MHLRVRWKQWGEDAAHEAETTGDEPSQPETEASIDNPFETEHVPVLRTLENGETIELLETKAFGALTARYYACASGTIENGAWTECLEIATPPEAVEASVPEGLSFEPFFCLREQRRNANPALRLRPGDWSSSGLLSLRRRQARRTKSERRCAGQPGVYPLVQ